MDSQSRKASIAAFKERKATVGIFAICCMATGDRWVGRAPDIDTIWRRLSFELGAGGHRRPSLQAAWNTHGAAGFAFELLERIEEEIDSVRDRKLKARLDHWRGILGADLA